MAHAHKAAPGPQPILRAWIPFKEAVGVTSVRTEGDYAQNRATIDAVIERSANTRTTPLAEVPDYLADQVKAYKREHSPSPRPSQMAKKQHTLYSEAAPVYQALADDDALIAQALSILEQRTPQGPAMTSPQAVKQYITLKLAPESREVFGVLLLDQRHRVLAFEVLFQGTLATCSVHPREVVKATLQHNAAAVIFTHNHPSGDPSPPEADKSLTARLREALALVDVRTLDHIIVVGGQALSFADLGLL